MNPSGNMNVEKLGETNYESWRLQMRSVLVCNELWNYADGLNVKPEDPAKLVLWDAKDAKALALILLGVKENQLSHIKKVKTSHEAWKVLEKVHASAGPTRKVVLYKRLFQIKKKSEQSMTQHLKAFQDNVDQLEETGIVIPKELLSIMLLNSLPEEYENFCIAIEARDDLPDIGSLKVRLREEDERRNDHNANERDGENPQNALLSKHRINKTKHYQGKTNVNSGKVSQQRFGQASNKKFEGNCYNCGKYGHRANTCRARKENSAVGEIAMTLTTTNAKVYADDEWWLDSGASSHMCNDRSKFSKWNSGARSIIYTAGNDTVIAYGSGTVTVNISAAEGKGTTEIKFQNVVYAPNLRHNLISVPRCTENGYLVHFGKEYAAVKRSNGTVVFKAERSGGMYVVTECRKENSCFARDNTEGFIKWHQRLGHLNQGDVRKLHGGNLVTGMDSDLQYAEIKCVVCSKGKISRLPFERSESRAGQVLGMVHSDICGPINVESFSGAKYFVTFIDDKTRYMQVAFLKNKSDVLVEFKKYKQAVERETGEKIKGLRTDNGKEYTSNDFSTFLSREGIRRQLTVEYTPQQNGVAERANRTLMEMTRCMLIESGLPKQFWAEALNTAVFIRNRCPTSALKNTTPYEAWKGKKPYIGFLKTFGSKVIALEKGPGRKKLDAKGKEYIFVGYSAESKAYRLWDSDKRLVIKRRDVKFFEEVDPNNYVLAGINLMEMEKEEVLEFEAGQKPEMKSKSEELSQAAGKEETLDAKKDANDEEDLQDTGSDSEGDAITPPRRKPGRPKIVKTGTRGRPRKLFNEEVNLAIKDFPDDPMNFEDAINREDKQVWMDAMKLELKLLQKNNTWEIINRPKNKKILTNKWVFCTKRKDDGTPERYKARLVVRGCEQVAGIDYDEVFAPVARYETIRTFMSICAEKQLMIHQMDVTTAYVQGELNDEIYMEQPLFPGSENSFDEVCKLMKPLYGLKQAGRQWHLRLDGFLKSLGMKQTTADPCLYVKKEAEEMIMIVVYVDDLLISSGSVTLLDQTKRSLGKEFDIRDLGEVSNILGINVKREDATGGIEMSQRTYIERLLEKYGMSEAKPVGTPMDVNRLVTKNDSPKTAVEIEEMKRKPYRELIGALIHLANATRPDIAFSVSVLSRFCSNPGNAHWIAAKRILRYLRGTLEFKIVYEKTGKELCAYVDSDWAGDSEDRKSCSGYVLMLANGPICWRSRKQKSVALSTMEAEYMALSEVSKEIVHRRRMLSEMDMTEFVTQPTLTFCDNQSAIKFSSGQVLHDRSKHIDIRYHFAREAQEKEIIKVEYLPSGDMVADILTKGLPKMKHSKCMELLGLN